MYRQSVEDPDAFWAEQAKEYYWNQKWEPKHFQYNLDVRQGPVSVEIFKGGTTNISYNCLDRHVEAGHGDRPCFLWEGNDPQDTAVMSYKEVLAEVCRLANWLKAAGLKPGDAVTLYMPMRLELPIAMLACARLGLVHSVVFAGFSAEALAGRVEDCKSDVLLTCSGVMRGAKKIELKAIVDKALDICASQHNHKVRTVLVVENGAAVGKAACPMTQGRDLWYDVELTGQAQQCPPVWMPSEARLFLLYTSGSTGKPKGVVHTTGGYMVYAGLTTKCVFDLHPGEVFWCTADCGWVTGHSYVTYGPLLCGATSVVFEGVPTWPDAARLWEVVDRWQVAKFYTAPTAIRALMRMGKDYVKRTKRDSLKILGSVGEPINPEAWRWYHQVVGEGRCPISDTWWQTETGGHMITPLPAAWPEKPGSATLPFFGVQPAIVNEKGEELHGPCEGYLCIKAAWPSTIRMVSGNVQRYHETYFAPFPGYYFSGDGARRDADGYYWITGRVDDVINVSGHRIGTAEVESALVAHPSCAEAAVVGYEHAIKGQGIYAYVTLNEGVEESDVLRKELKNIVRS